MQKTLKYGLIAVASLLALVVLGLAVFALTFNPNDYKPLIVKLVQEKKQRTLTIDGDIKLAFWPKLGADLGHVALSEHKSNANFASIDHAKVSVALLPLLAKNLVVDGIYIDGVKATLVRHADGSTNIDDLLSQDDEPSEAIQFDIDGVHVSNSSLAYLDEATKAEYKLTELTLESGHVAPGKAFPLEAGFRLQATQPSLNITASMNSTLMADPQAKHVSVSDLALLVKGDIADAKQTQLEIKGNIDAALEKKTFALSQFSSKINSQIQGATWTIELQAPALQLINNSLNGKAATLNVSRKQADGELTANTSLAEITGSATDFRSAGLSSDIQLTDTNGKLKAHVQLKDVQGSATHFKTAGIQGHLDLVQGARKVVADFDAPFKGQLDTKVFEIPSIKGQAKIEDPSLPAGKANVVLDGQAKADLTKQLVDSTLKLSIDNSTLTAQVGVNGFSPAKLKFDIHADTLDLNKLLGASKSTAAPAASKPSPVKAPDLSVLKTVHADGKLSIDQLLYQSYKVQQLALTLQADGQRLLIQPLTLKLDDTNIKGSLGVRQFERALFTFDIDIDQINLDRYVPASTEPASSSKSTVAGPPDLSALKALNADGSIRIGDLKYGKNRASNVRLDLKADGQKLSLAPFQANIDGSAIQANLGITRFERPVFSFKVDIDKLDADKYITKSEPTTTKPASNEDTPIDLQALKSLNASGSASIGWLKLANIKTSNVQVSIQANEGQVSVSPFSANLYEGAMKGSLTVDARATPNIHFQQAMSGIQIGPLLVDAINNDMLDGKGTLDVDIRTQGQSVNALKKALAGTAALNLADGAVKGVDIAGTIRDFKSKLNVLGKSTSVDGDKRKKTDFSEMTASFTIKNGVAHNEDLAMKAPILRLAKGDSRGDIDIANQTIQYTTKPTLVSSLKGQGGADLDDLSGIGIPIKISGTFANPKYGMDLAALGSAMAKSKLTEKLGAQKGDAVGKLIGGDSAGAINSLLTKPSESKPTTTTESSTANTNGQSAEQTNTQPAPSAEDKAKEKAKKKLNKLLGL